MSFFRWWVLATAFLVLMVEAARCMPVILVLTDSRDQNKARLSERLQDLLVRLGQANGLSDRLQIIVYDCSLAKVRNFLPELKLSERNCPAVALAEGHQNMVDRLLEPAFQFKDPVQASTRVFELARRHFPDIQNFKTRLTQNLVISSDPPGAEVYLFGSSKGRTPITLEVPTAAQLSLSKPDHLNWTQTLSLKYGETRKVHAVLEYGLGRLRLEPSVRSIVYLDGNTPCGGTPREFDLTAGYHRVKLTANGHYPTEDSILVKGGVMTTVTHQMILCRPSGKPTLPEPNVMVSGISMKDPPKGPPVDDKISVGGSLSGGLCIESINGIYRFVCQTDGNCVVYRVDGPQPAPIWHTDTKGQGCRLVLESGGRMRLLDRGGQSLWESSGSVDQASGTCQLQMQGDGNLVVYRHTGDTFVVVWASKREGAGNNI